MAAGIWDTHWSSSTLASLSRERVWERQYENVIARGREVTRMRVHNELLTSYPRTVMTSGGLLRVPYAPRNYYIHCLLVDQIGVASLYSICICKPPPASIPSSLIFNHLHPTVTCLLYSIQYSYVNDKHTLNFYSHHIQSF